MLIVAPNPGMVQIMNDYVLSRYSVSRQCHTMRQRPSLDVNLVPPVRRSLVFVGVIHAKVVVWANIL